jgi:hypothetical protein
MTIDKLLLTAVSLQRDGRSPEDIHATLLEIARLESLDCHTRRNFAGHSDLVFDDGRSLRFDGGVWTLRQEDHVAPIYEAALAPFVSEVAHG